MKKTRLIVQVKQMQNGSVYAYAGSIGDGYYGPEYDCINDTYENEEEMMDALRFFALQPDPAESRVEWYSWCHGVRAGKAYIY